MGVSPTCRFVLTTAFKRAMQAAIDKWEDVECEPCGERGGSGGSNGWLCGARAASYGASAAASDIALHMQHCLSHVPARSYTNCKQPHFDAPEQFEAASHSRRCDSARDEAALRACLDDLMIDQGAAFSLRAAWHCPHVQRQRFAWLRIHIMHAVNTVFMVISRAHPTPGVRKDRLKN